MVCCRYGEVVYRAVEFGLPSGLRPTVWPATRWARGVEFMYARAALIAVILAALLVYGLTLMVRESPVVASIEQTPTQAPTSTNPPAPPSPTPRPSATPWLDAPYNSYVQPVMKPEATPTPTQVPGTPTSPPVGPSPAHRDYLPSVWEMVSTATATISPDATPTPYITPTAPSPDGSPPAPVPSPTATDSSGATPTQGL
jgi:hypothetical protein